MSQLGAHVLGHIVRRSMDQSNKIDSPEQKQPNWEADIELSTWQITILAATVAFFAIQIFKVQYMVGHVVPTLAMVEHPSSSTVIETKVTETFSDDEPDATIEKAPLLDVEQTVQTVSGKPITSGLKATLKHLQAQGGRKTRYRGLGVGILYTALRVWTLILVGAVMPDFGPLSLVLGAGITAAITSPVHCIWTHSTITAPTDLTLKQYTTTHGKQIKWKTLLWPAFISAVMMEASLQLMVTTNDLVQELVDGASDWKAALGAAAIIFVSLFGTFFSLSSLVVLKRVEASLLPEELETLVPIDRTFGGMVDVNDASVSVLARMRAANRSVDRKHWRRIIGAYIKGIAVITAVVFIAIHVIVVEAVFVLGDQLKVILQQIAMMP